MQRPNLEIVYKPLAKLIPYAKNARTHSEAQVAAIAGSIREFGFTNPILLDEHDGIIAGHGRVMAAMKLALIEVPTITLAGLTEVQKRAYIIADNKLALDAGWDAELLALELQDIRAQGFDLAYTGFSTEELENLIRGTQPSGPESEVKEDTAPEPPKNPITKAGDVWLLGRHRLICGDSTDPRVIKTLMDGRVSGLMVTDPPYGVSVVGGTHDPRAATYKRDPTLTIQNDELTGDKLRAFLRSAFEASMPALAAGASWYVWFAGSETRAFIESAEVLGGFRHMLVWVKPNFVFGRSDYHYRHEPCLYGWRPGAAHTWLGDRKQSSVFELSRDGAVAPSTHPTVKPVELYAIPIRNHLGADGALLDPFAGSGPAFSAAEQLGRTCYGVELAPGYCDVIVERWQTLTGQKATRKSA